MAATGPLALNPKIYKHDVNLKYKTKEAAVILLDVINHPEKCSFEKTVMKLKGGEAYIYKYEDDKKASDWKSDGSRFNSYQVGPRESHAKIEEEKVGVYTHYSYIALSPEAGSSSKKALKSDKFKRIGFWLTKYPKYILVQYLGDHLVGKDFSHGNNRDESTVHMTSNKSMRDEIKDRVEGGEKCGNIYKHMTRLRVTENSSVLEVMVNAPKSHKQIQNLKQTSVAKSKFSQDEWYNAFVLASQLKDGALVRSLNIYPNLEVTLADPRMIQEYSFLVKVKIIEFKL